MSKQTDYCINITSSTDLEIQSKVIHYHCMANAGCYQRQEENSTSAVYVEESRRVYKIFSALLLDPNLRNPLARFLILLLVSQKVLRN